MTKKVVIQLPSEQWEYLKLLAENRGIPIDKLLSDELPQPTSMQKQQSKVDLLWLAGVVGSCCF